jgi:hypothetical protein
MSNRTIQLNQIEPSIFLVKGTLTFSRLTKQIAGDALEKDKQRRVAQGKHPRNKPYTVASVNNATIFQTNPSPMTPAEIYGQESFYTSQAHPGYNFSGENSGNRLPWIGVSYDGGKTVNQIKPQGELDSGNEVILVMRIYKSNNGSMNNGKSLDGVIVLGEPKYYTSQGANLSQYGITFNPLADEADFDDASHEDKNNTAPQAPVAFQQAPVAPQQAPFQQTPPFSNPGTPFGGMNYNPNN